MDVLGNFEIKSTELSTVNEFDFKVEVDRDT